MKIFTGICVTSLLVVGCKHHAIETELDSILIPETLLTACPYPEPPDPLLYVKKSYHEKEKELMNIYIDGLESIQECNIKLEKIRNIMEHYQTDRSLDEN